MTLTLSRLVAQVESENNPTLVRYEPNWRYTTHECVAKFHRAHRPGKMTGQTALMLLSCSWGKYQIMGSNLYDMGYSEPLVKFAASEYLQELWFHNFIQLRKINFTLSEIIGDKEKREQFAHRYNGDKTVYSARLLNVYEKLKGI